MSNSRIVASSLLVLSAIIGIAACLTVATAFNPLVTSTVSVTSTSATTTTTSILHSTSITATATSVTQTTTTLSTTTSYGSTTQSGSVALSPLFNTNLIIYGLLIVGVPLMLLILARTLLAFVGASIAMNCLAIPLNLVPWYAAIANIFMCLVVLILFREQGEAPSD